MIRSKLIYRLEHIFQIGEHPTLSQPASYRLSKYQRIPMWLNVRAFIPRFLTGLEVVWMRETQLGADRWLNNEEGGELEDDLVTLQPMDIRTFIIKIQT